MKKLLTIVILPLIIIGLGYAIVRSLTAPIKFDKERDFRSSLAIERLKDIRTLQTTYKTEFGKYILHSTNSTKSCAELIEAQHS